MNEYEVLLINGHTLHISANAIEPHDNQCRFMGGGGVILAVIPLGEALYIVDREYLSVEAKA